MNDGPLPAPGREPICGYVTHLICLRNQRLSQRRKEKGKSRPMNGRSSYSLSRGQSGSFVLLHAAVSYTFFMLKTAELGAYSSVTGVSIDDVLQAAAQNLSADFGIPLAEVMLSLRSLFFCARVFPGRIRVTRVSSSLQRSRPISQSGATGWGSGPATCNLCCASLALRNGNRPRPL